MKIVFWQCLVPEHRDRKTMVTVVWKDGVAHCTYPNCDLTSEHTDYFKETVIKYHPDLDKVIEWARWVMAGTPPPTMLEPPLDEMHRLMEVRSER